MITRLIKYAFKNILRNKFLSISSVLVLTLLMFFINILVILHNVSFKLIDSINSRLTISLYIKDEYNQDSVEIKKFLRNLNNTWEQIWVDYKSKDEVLEDLKQKDEELVKIIEWINPLPATINLSNIKIWEYEKIDSVISENSFLLSNSKSWSDYLSSYNSQYERIMKVITILKALQFWLYFIISIFLLAISIIIYSIIWNFVYHYRDEIYITKLVWWSDKFIYWPFSIQWLIYSVLSFAVSLLLFMLLLNNMNFLFTQASYDFYIFNNGFYLIFLVELIIFSILWWMSWYLSSKKYLK